VLGDAARLGRALAQLLDNAVKFAAPPPPPGEVAVRVLVDGGQACLSVRDAGMGIAPELLPRLFEVFTQADRTLERTRGGLGLGLALVRAVVRLHGGDVAAASGGPGRGAEFTIRLPLAGAAAAEAAGAHAAPPVRRVLIVEDNQDTAESLRMLLEVHGHEVAVATTGPAGVRAALDWRPDVVLCDIGLPGLDGYGVARELRRNPATAGLLLVAVTGYGREEDRLRSREAGFDHHLTKPVDPAELQPLLVGLPRR
jgi:two-component system CheB/CheR fusion protein